MIDMHTTSSGISIPMHTYHYGDGWRDLLSSHKFLPFYQSPACYRYPLPDSGTTEAMRLGQLFAHAIECVAKDQDPQQGIFIMPERGFQSVADKSAWGWLQEEFGIQPATTKAEILSNITRAVNEQGLVLATQAELDGALAEAHSVYANPHAVELLRDAEHELTYAADGRKARPDLLADNVLIDFKRSAVNPRWWSKNAHEFGYPQQAAWYERVMAECGRYVDTWAWIVIDPKPYRLDASDKPVHRVDVWLADRSTREIALEKLEQALKQLEHCRRLDNWPDAYSDIYNLYPTYEDQQ